MELDPRISQILFILLEANRPIGIDEIATQLSISRRTLYRELKNIAPILNHWQLELETVSGKGVSLIGSEKERLALQEQIQHSDAFDPKNRKARQTVLTALLLQQTEPKKSFYFASVLQVSESTVNNDLQDLVPWFREYGLEILKRPGYGIYPEGKETDFRRACLRWAHDNQEFDFTERIRQHHKSEIFHLLDSKVLYQIMDILLEFQQNFKFSITEGFFIILLTYLTIACHRMSAGHYLKSSDIYWKTEETLLQDTALVGLLEQLEQAFGLHITLEEADAIQIYLKGAKPRYLDKEIDFLEDDNHLASLIREMLDCFEPNVRFYLEHDSDFFPALAAHLKPALVRLQHNIQVDNPLLQEVKENYPELYQKAMYAGEIIKNRLGYEVSENEIGLLAVHFGSALFRYNHTYKARRQVYIGVVCSSGIGISRLLTAQLQNAFDEKIKLSIYGESFQDIHTTHVDFIITTFPLDICEKRILQVHPILTDSDIEHIHQYISFYALQPDQPSEQTAPSPQILTDSINRMLAIGRDAKLLLSHFAIHYIAPDTQFDTLVRFLGIQFGQTPIEQKQIYQDILKREQICTQIVPEYSLAFLHARTAGTKEPGFLIVYPDGNAFTDPYLQGCTVAIGMVIPQTEKQNEVLGAISDMLFSQDDFLNAILDRDQSKIHHLLQEFMKEYLKNHIPNIF